jgi:hypothetical protein
VLFVIGALLVVTGLLWVGQGTGIIAWPRSSFMIDQRPWIWRGALLALVGAGLIWISRRG